MYFDSHSHYDDAKFDNDREEIFASFPQNNVKYIVNIGTNLKTCLKSVELAKKYDFIYATVGVHPNYAVDATEKDLEIIQDLLINEKKVVGIGEIGLDYYYDYSPKEIQQQIFTKQLNFYESVTKPVIIHSRDACQDVFDLINKSKVRKGVIHAYSGSAELAKEYVKLGFHIGVGGVVTFKNAKKLVEVVKTIPLEHILIETDAPYLTPTPFRGTRNNSTYLKYVVEKIAEIKDLSPEEVAKTTFDNAQKFFQLENL